MTKVSYVTIGGISTVRGHLEGADSGRMGRTTGLELRQRLALTCDVARGATLLAFVDHGRIGGAATGGTIERNSAGLGAVLAAW